MVRSLAVAVFASVLVVACAEDADGVALKTAKADFQCADVQMTTLEAAACPPHQGCIAEFRATGCEQTALYHCFGAANYLYDCKQSDYTTVSSTVTINGNAFVPDGEKMCMSGANEGQEFYGVDLNAPDGDTVRIIRNADYAIEVVGISNDKGTSSSPMRDCATVHFNDTKGLSGVAAIDCSSGPWVIKGDVKFQGCN